MLKVYREEWVTDKRHLVSLFFFFFSSEISRIVLPVTSITWNHNPVDYYEPSLSCCNALGHCITNCTIFVGDWFGFCSAQSVLLLLLIWGGILGH